MYKFMDVFTIYDHHPCSNSFWVKKSRVSRVWCFEINTFLITSKEKFTKLSFCLLCFMGVRFGSYEKTYSTDSVASIRVVFVACVVSAFVMPFIIT